MVTHDNFDLTKAGHTKQAAYAEMTQVQDKLTALSTEVNERTAEINQRQTEFDEIKRQSQAEWDEYNKKQLAYKEDIAGKITGIKECNVLEENFRLMAERDGEDPNKALIYAAGADFFSRLASETMLERDQLISKKRAIIRPDTSRSAQMLQHLKQLRSERDELLNDYHTVKNEFSLKKSKFDRAKDRYNAIKNGTKIETNDFRPITLDNLKNQRLLVQAEIPSEYYETCIIKKRADDKIDIYYGGDYGTEHGHVILDENEQVIYTRSPKSNSNT